MVPSTPLPGKNTRTSFPPPRPYLPSRRLRLSLSFPPPAPPQAHPLFPSATPGATPPLTYPASARPDPYHNIRRTNICCVAGCIFGVIAFLLSFACGVGLFPALLAIIFCVVGLVQVHKHPEQAGQRRAIAGLILAIVALIIAVVMFIYLGLPMIKAHEITVTEQTSNDSE